MKMMIQGLNLDLTSAILEHVRRRLNHGLGPFAPRVRAVRVRVSDVNGTRGGADKRCLLEVSAGRAGNVRVEEVDADLYCAVDRVAARVRRVLARKFGRHRARRFGPRVSASGLPT